MRLGLLFLCAWTLIGCNQNQGQPEKPTGATTTTKTESRELDYIEKSSDTTDGTTKAVSCTKTLQPGDKNKYLGLLDAYYVGNPNIPFVVKKYREFFNNNYYAKIANSKIDLYQNTHISSKFLLKQQINSASAKKVKVNIIPSPYIYENNRAYVDFANKLIGGGVLGHGFVQEEIEMLESAFLPFIAEIRKTNKQSLDFCPDIDLVNLDTTPVLIRMPMFLEIHPRGKSGTLANIYGSNVVLLNDANVGNYYTIRNPPVDIFTIAVAAKDVSGAEQKAYAIREIGDMTMASAKGFYLAIEKMDKENFPINIHTGNWGAGAFANSVYMAYAMQFFALLAATELYIKNHPTFNKDVNFTYNAYDARNESRVKDANTTIEQWMTSERPSTLTLKDAILFMHQQSQGNLLWQKKS